MRLNIHLPDDVGQRLSQVSKASGQSKTALVIDALTQLLPKEAPQISGPVPTRSYVRRSTIKSRVIKPHKGPTQVVGLKYHVSGDEVWFELSSVAAQLKVDEVLISDELDDEDIKVQGGDTCISYYGIQSALSMAKREGLDFESLERLIEDTLQEINQGNT